MRNKLRKIKIQIIITTHERISCRKYDLRDRGPRHGAIEGVTLKHQSIIPKTKRVFRETRRTLKSRLVNVIKYIGKVFQEVILHDAKARSKTPEAKARAKALSSKTEMYS